MTLDPDAVHRVPPAVRSRVRSLLTCALALVVAYQCWQFVTAALHHDQVDFGVYRAGAKALLDGVDLYRVRVGALHLPFTYPPVAALIFVPFASFAKRAEQAVWALGSLVALWYVIRLGLRRYAPPAHAGSVLSALVVFALVAHSNPLRVGMSLGQINVFIALLVLADFSGSLRRVPRGALIGIAAAIKLTPAFLVLYLVVVRRYRAAAVATGTFVAVSLAALAFSPSTSLQYWFHGYFSDAGRAGNVEYISNQSLNGLLVRFAGSVAHARPLWLLAAPVVAGLVLVIVHRAHVARPWLGEAVAMAGMLIVSPISWVHHWVIVLPLLLAAWRCADEATFRVKVLLLSATAALAAVLLFGVVWKVPIANSRVLHASVAQFVVGNSQILLLLALLACVAVFVWTAPAAPRPLDGEDDISRAVARSS